MEGSSSKSTQELARIMKEKILNLDWFVLPYLPYSAELAPSDFFLKAIE